MPISTRVTLLLTAWIVSEVLAFVGVAHVIGVGWALLAGLATTLVGASLLKRAGAATMLRLRGALGGRHDGRIEDVLDGGLLALAAAALILPGFLSDALGLCLAIPAVRARTTRWVRRGGLGPRFRRGNHAAPQTIDLERDQWTRTRPPREGGELLR